MVKTVLVHRQTAPTHTAVRILDCIYIRLFVSSQKPVTKRKASLKQNGNISRNIPRITHVFFIIFQFPTHHICLECSYTVGWAEGTESGPQETEWRHAGGDDRSALTLLAGRQEGHIPPVKNVLVTVRCR